MLFGKLVADAFIPEIAERAGRLAETGVKPRLAVLRVGDRADSVSYENAIAGRASSVGVHLRRVALRADADAALVANAVRDLARDGEVHGILAFRPLPGEAAALTEVPPEKDVDGVSAAQMAGLYSMKRLHEQEGAFFPCTAEAVIRILDHYEVPIAGRRAVVIGRSTVIGKPAAHLLLARDATVTVCHSGTPDLAAFTRGADILVCAAGLAREGRSVRLGADHLSRGQTVIDAAVNEDANGMYGDVDTDVAAELVSAVTPVPGGLGAVTTAVLVEHVVRAAERSARGAAVS